jgi:hypothetical protein
MLLKVNKYDTNAYYEEVREYPYILPEHIYALKRKCIKNESAHE